MHIKKKQVFKLKKPEEKPSEVTAMDLLPRITNLLDKISALKKVDIEFDEVIIQGLPISIGAQIAHAIAPPVPPVVAPPAPPLELPEFQFSIPKKEYKRKINEVRIGATKDEGGQRAYSITIGGNTVPPFYKFEGEMGHRPVIAHTVFDSVALPMALKEYFRDVVGEPVKWAEKCINEFKAKAIALMALSMEPRFGDKSPQEAFDMTKKVIEATDVPLIVSATSGDLAKDFAFIKRCAEFSRKERILFCMTSMPLGIPISPAQPLADEIYQYFRIMRDHGHVACSFGPMQVMLISWLNKVGLTEGVPNDRLVCDPLFSAQGYGIELTTTAIDTIYQRGLGGDETLQTPIVVCPANAWMAVEPHEEKEEWGPLDKRGHMWETVAASVAIAAGAHLLLMLDPVSIQACEKFIDMLYSAPKPIDRSKALSWITKLEK